MPFDLEFDEDLAQRRLQRLEHRYLRAQKTLAGARAVYGSLRELPGTSALQMHQALQQVERVQQHLADIQFDMELAEAQAAAPEDRLHTDPWTIYRR